MTDRQPMTNRRALLFDLRTALGDWCTTQFPEWCGDENVAAAKKRLRAGGGTANYIGVLVSRINDELEATSDEPSSGPTA